MISRISRMRPEYAFRMHSSVSHRLRYALKRLLVSLNWLRCSALAAANARLNSAAMSRSSDANPGLEQTARAPLLRAFPQSKLGVYDRSREGAAAASAAPTAGC